MAGVEHFPEITDGDHLWQVLSLELSPDIVTALAGRVGDNVIDLQVGLAFWRKSREPGVKIFRLLETSPFCYEEGANEETICALRQIKWADYNVNIERDRVCLFVKVTELENYVKRTQKRIIFIIKGGIVECCTDLKEEKNMTRKERKALQEGVRKLHVDPPGNKIDNDNWLSNAMGVGWVNNRLTFEKGSKKFLVGKFLEFKMEDGKSVVSQVEELQIIIHEILQEGYKICKGFQVASIIEKLPSSWKEYKNSLKHKKKEMTLEDLIVNLRIEEDNRKAEINVETSEMKAKANLVEGQGSSVMDSNKYKKFRDEEGGAE